VPAQEAATQVRGVRGTVGVPAQQATVQVQGLHGGRRGQVVMIMNGCRRLTPTATMDTN
jgi:hypothetical protein